MRNDTAALTAAVGEARGKSDVSRASYVPERQLTGGCERGARRCVSASLWWSKGLVCARARRPSRLPPKGKRLQREVQQAELLRPHENPSQTTRISPSHPALPIEQHQRGAHVSGRSHPQLPAPTRSASDTRSPAGPRFRDGFFFPCAVLAVGAVPGGILLISMTVTAAFL